jgi:hypothetical protein
VGCDKYRISHLEMIYGVFLESIQFKRILKKDKYFHKLTTSRTETGSYLVCHVWNEFAKV